MPEIKKYDKQHLLDCGFASFTVFLIITAPRHCLNAHITIISGASIEKNIRNSRRPSISHFPSSLNGTFGWTDNQVHVNVVAKQLHRIFHTVRWLQPSAAFESLRGRRDPVEYVLSDREAPSVKLPRNRSTAKRMSNISRVTRGLAKKGRTKENG